MADLKVDTWMPLYPGDYLRDTSRLTTIQHGAYFLLILDYWMKGPPPDNDEVLASITKIPEKEWKGRHRKALEPFFVIEDGVWRHGRIEEELAGATVMREQKSIAGKASAEKRKGNSRSTAVGTGEPTAVGTDVPTAGSTARQRRVNPSPSPSPEPFSSGDKSPSVPVLKLVGDSPPINRGSATDGVTAETWSAYSAAYASRYGVPPVRNATVNGQLAAFVRRVGRDEAPQIAVFYLTHNARFYVQRGHSVGLLLQDAETLRTQWATNRRVTSTEAAQADRTATRGQVFTDLIEEFHGTE